MYKGEYLSEKINVENICIWLLRMSLDDEGSFKFENTRTNSMLMLYEVASTCCEFAHNKLIVALDPSDFLIARDWEPIRHIHSTATGNIEKNYMIPHPDFDEDEFPFLVCSGTQFYVLINVKQFHIQMFIDASCSTVKSQQAFFF